MTDSKIDDGGPVFPSSRWEQVGNLSDHGFPIDGEDSPTYADVEYSGMSLRHWYAGQALVSLGTWMPVCSDGELENPETMAQRALLSFKMADAMIAASKAGG